MIILGFSATNILKYRELEATDIPATGLIGISGPNEAGKSTIAEALCLGLYGRTFSYDTDHFTKAIRWGAASGEIRVDFAVDNEASYSVTRYFDNDGNHSALLSLRGSDDTISQGADEVTARVEELTGCSFQQYVDSFYLAQREFDIPHAQSDMIKGLLGIRDLDAVTNSLSDELQDDEALLAELEKTIALHQQRCGQLSADSEDLQALEDKQATAQTETDTVSEQQAQLTDTATQIEQQIGRLRTSVEDNLALPEDSSFKQFDDNGTALTTNVEQLTQLCTQQTGIEPSDASPLSLWADQQAQRLAPLKQLIEQGKHNAHEWKVWLGDIDPEPTSESEDPDAKDLAEKDPAEKDEETAESSTPATSLKTSQQATGYPEQRDSLQLTIGLLPGKRRLRRLIAMLSLSLGGLGAWAWWLFSKHPNNDTTKQLQEALNQYLPQFQPQLQAEQILTLQYLAIGLLIAGILFALLSNSLTRKLARARGSLALLNQQADLARDEIRSLDNIESVAISEILIRLETLSDEAIVAETLTFTAEGASALIQSDEWDQHRADLKRTAPTVDLIQRSLNAQLDDALHAAQNRCDEQQQHLLNIGEMIADEQQRREESSQLNDEILELTDQQDDPADRIVIRKAGLDLLKGTVRRIYTDFNQQMREYLGRLLPLFTEGRYQHLKIDDDFSVQVFSTEKNDFAELDDLSSGTQRQLILAIRLAMSQAMVDSHQQTHQSLILDEPFAFFDRERMRQTLATLQSFSQEISQVWVISQEFDSDAPFDVIIPCQRDQDSIVINTAAPRPPQANTHHGKYSPLEQYLKNQALNPGPINLTFAEIEDIIETSLPQSAYKNRDWWSNHNDPSHRPQAKAWMEAGYQVENLKQNKDSGEVSFTRN